MKLALSLLLALFPLITYAGGGGGCAIENGTSPKLTEYFKNTTSEVTALRNAAQRQNQCRGNPGSFTNERRFGELLDTIDARNPQFPDLLTDFRYNILLVANGKSRTPVMNQGILFRKMETSTIIPALQAVANNCVLDLPYQNTTYEAALTNMLKRNRELETYYKNVALGDPRNIDGIETSLADDIMMNYSPEKTLPCKDGGLNGGVGESIGEIVGKLMERIQRFSFGTSTSHENWKYAIALFRGTLSKEKYDAVQRQLLSQELSRQGLSRRSAELMLGNLSCIQRKNIQNGEIEEWGRARSECFQNVIIGAENLTNWMKKYIIQSNNTDQYIARRLLYENKYFQSAKEMTEFWQTIETITKEEDEALNEKILTDLVDLHARILETNALIKKHTPAMQENCRKAQPEIECPR